MNAPGVAAKTVLTPAAAPETAFFLSALHGFGPEARTALRHLAAWLLPLPPEGDVVGGLWLRRETALEDWRSTPKLCAAAGCAPAAWGPPQLVLCLLDSTAPVHRQGLIGTLARCEADTLAVVLAPPGQDAAALYADLLRHTRARLGVFETLNPEPLAREALARALLASLYRENLICLDFADLRTILPGTGVAWWYRQGEGLERLRAEQARITVHGEAIGVFCGVVAGADCALEAFESFGEIVMTEVEGWEAAGVSTTVVSACLIDARVIHGWDAFVFSASRTLRR